MNNNRAKLISCPTSMSSLVTSINGTLTMVVKTANGFPFTVCVCPDKVFGITTRQIADCLTREITMFSHTVIGRLARPGFDLSPDEGFWPQIKDEYLQKHLTATREQFWKLIDNYGKWDSFADFLQADIGYDVDTDIIAEQTPLEYYCLVGRIRSSKTIHPFAKYKKQSLGVFIDPADKTIPLYTSSLMADMSAQHYREKYAVNLLPNSILCLGCFLIDFRKENGRKVLAGSLLNDQWPVDFIHCDEQRERKVDWHIVLQDNSGAKYSLIGCPETYSPVWAAVSSCG